MGKMQKCMGKRNKRSGNNKNKPQKVKIKNNDISLEQLVEIHTQAYYKAMKRIEQEKADSEKESHGQKKNEWHMALFCINVFLFPFRINKRFHIQNRIYENLIVLLVSFLLQWIGIIIWAIGIITAIYGMFHLPETRTTIYLISLLLVAGVLICYGSILIIAGREFEKEKDSNRIYAFSAFVMALASLIVGVITLINNF